MTPRKLIEQYSTLLAKHGSQRAVARKLGIPRTTIQEWLAKRDRILYSEQSPADAIIVGAPKRVTKRFIFTSAQDNTAVHVPFLRNLEAYAEHLGAKLIVAGFTYNKSLFEDHRVDHSVFASEVVPYLSNRRIEIGDNLMFCGEMNTLPTAVSPLNGFETYTREKWGIFPHAKVQLVSVPTMKHSPAKQLMTTGAVTKPNYVQKRAGIRAHFHHVYGAVLVEIDCDGDHFCRHLLGDKDDGSFQDLTTVVAAGEVTDGHRVEAINWGDIHVEALDKPVANATVGLNGMTESNMLDWLRPRFQLIHDVSDFKVRNHHNLKDPHFRLKMFVNGTDSVETEMEGVAAYLESSRRPWCRSVVVESNHDLALLRWLKESDWKTDPVNALFYLEAQLECVRAIHNNNRNFSVLEWALKRFYDLDGVVFLREDQSYKVQGIEMGMHGHLGANGSRGSPKQFTRMGPKANTGHTHCLTAGHKANVAGKGFVDLADVQIGDEVVGFDPKSGRNVWTKVLDVIAGEHTGRILQFGSGLFRQTVTENHHLFLKDGSYIPVGEAVAFRSATEVPIVAGALDCKEGVTLDDRFLQQIVAVAADGHVDMTANTIRFHVKKERKVSRISALFGDSLTREPTLSSTGSYKATISTSNPLHGELMEVFRGGKRLPSWLLGLDNRQTKLILDELRYWDGTFDTGNNGRQFSTSKTDEAMLISAMCNKLGFRVSAKRRCERDNNHIITWCDGDRFLRDTVASHDKERITSWGVHTKAVENEPVFCLTTDSSNFWVMHPTTGQVSLTGNSAGIIDGIYTAGTCSKLDMGYNKGLSSWSHSHIITYPSGKRTICTMQNGKWCAA